MHIHLCVFCECVFVRRGVILFKTCRTNSIARDGFCVLMSLAKCKHESVVGVQYEKLQSSMWLNLFLLIFCWKQLMCVYGCGWFNARAHFILKIKNNLKVPIGNSHIYMQQKTHLLHRCWFHLVWELTIFGLISVCVQISHRLDATTLPTFSQQNRWHTDEGYFKPWAGAQGYQNYDIFFAIALQHVFYCFTWFFLR